MIPSHSGTDGYTHAVAELWMGESYGASMLEARLACDKAVIDTRRRVRFGAGVNCVECRAWLREHGVRS